MCCIPVPLAPELLAGLGPVALALAALLAVGYLLTHYFTALLLAGLGASCALLAVIVRHVRRDARDGFDVAAHNARARALSAPEPVHQPRAHKTHARCTYRGPVPPLVDRGSDPDWAESTSPVPAVLQGSDQR